jgi:hypothetical protein
MPGYIFAQKLQLMLSEYILKTIYFRVLKYAAAGWHVTNPQYNSTSNVPLILV